MAEISGTDIVKGAMMLMGRPSQADLPYQDVVDVVADVVGGALFDLKTSNNNRTAVVGEWRTPTATIESTQSYVTAEDFFIPIKCEWQTIDGETNYQTPNRVELCALESIDELALTPREYASIYDNDSKIRFGQTLPVLSTREYRLIYETLDDIEWTQLGSSVENFPSVFVHWAQHKTAAKAIYLVRNGSEEWSKRMEKLLVPLMAGLVEWEMRLDRWTNQRFGNRKVYKPGYQAPGRY